MPTQPLPASFPASVDSVPESERISENFGWVPGGLGALAVVTVLASLVRPELWDRLLAGLDPKSVPAASLSAAVRVGLLSIGAGLIWWEFRRRSRRTVLVWRNGLVGIYRSGHFVEEIGPARMTVFRLNAGVTLIMALMPLACVGLIVGSLSGAALEPLMLLSGIALIIGDSSSLFTRTRFVHWIVPTKGRWGEEQIMLKKAEVKRLFDERWRNRR
jgi:hypothetical protein